MTEPRPDGTPAADALDGEDAETAKLREEVSLLWALDLGDAEMAVTFTPATAREA